MSSTRDELLQPSLSGSERPAAAPYSMATTFLSGFFGGPFGAAGILAVNSFRLRRFGRDLPVWVGLLAALLVGVWALGHTAAGHDIRAWIDAQLGKSGMRYVYKIAGLIIVGVGYFMHRREQRNTDLVGLTRPNGWIAGIACIVIGTLLMAGFVSLINGEFKSFWDR